MFRLWLMTLALGAVHAQTNNLLDNFVATFATQGDTTKAKELINLLEGCTASSDSTNLLQTIFSDSLNATRTCWTTEVKQENAQKCIEKASSAFSLSTSPYDLFSSQVLSNDDQSLIASCAAGVNSNAKVISSFKVLSKRFLQCDFTDLTESSSSGVALLDVFGDDDESSEPTQQQKVSRSQLATLCTSLDYAGKLHKDMVAFVEQTLKHMTAMLPQRR